MDISRETFRESDGPTRELLLFDSIMNLSKRIDAYTEKTDERITGVSRSNRYMSAGGGLIGGFMAAIGLRFLS